MTPALQAAVAVNSIIATCYFVISTLIFIGLVRQRHLGFNALATATWVWTLPETRGIPLPSLRADQ